MSAEIPSGFSRISVVSSIGILPIGRLFKAIQLSHSEGHFGLGTQPLENPAKSHLVLPGPTRFLVDFSPELMMIPDCKGGAGICEGKKSHRMQEAAGEGSVFKS